MDPLEDLVFQPQLERTMSKASRCCQNCSNTSILEVRGRNTPKWAQNLDLDGLRASTAQIRSLLEHHDSERVLRIFFISGHREPDSYHVHIDPDVLGLLKEKVGMSARFLSDVYETEEWTRLDFGSVSRRGPKSGSRFLDVHYGFWSWDTDYGHSFVQFQTDFTTTTYFCVNFPPETVERIVQSVNTRPVCAKRLFYIDVLITDDLLNSYRRAITSRNSQLIGIEKETDNSGIAVQTKRLHALSVSWHTIYKDLVDLEEQVQHFKELYETHIPDKNMDQENEEDERPAPLGGCDQPLAQLGSKCRFYRRWAMTYRDRTTSRINLLHHLAMQQDNRLNQHIGNVTTQVALQTQRDSASMFTLAVVTTVFLPPTFVAGVFGTPFFNAGDTKMNVSTSVWIFPAIAVPLTAVVISVWLWWFRNRLRRDRSAIRRTQKGLWDPEIAQDWSEYIGKDVKLVEKV